MMETPAVIRNFNHLDFGLQELVGAKGGRRISVCLPAHDEAATVGQIVERVGEVAPLVDEVLVVDDGSFDATGPVAAAAGARVVRTEGVGKGGALWQAVAEAEGDLIAFCDADLRDFDPRFVVGLVGPLLCHDDVAFVKAYYERPLDGEPRGGGRVTELVAKPVVALLFPDLAPFRQPLAGEYASRRDVLEQLPFVEGYGVDLGLLLDAAAVVGVDALVQVDLGVRVHRNRSIDELRPIATEVLATALHRAGVDVPLRQRQPLGHDRLDAHEHG